MITKEVDPQGEHALGLLREAAVEAHELYPELDPDRWPTNGPTPDRGVYLITYLDHAPVASGALRPMDDTVVEVRRMFVLKHVRRRGVGRHMLRQLEAAARRLGFKFIRLETGHRQTAAMALYEASGFRRIAPFGCHVNDPTSICYEKALAADL